MITEAVHFNPQASAPPRKATRAQIYVKNDGRLYFTNASGQEQAVAMLAGGSIDLSQVWPIGSIFIAAVATNPSTLIGFGTWARFGQGRMPISQDGGDADFDTAEETGGAKTHTQTTAEMPVHTHVQDAHAHNITTSPLGGGTNIMPRRPSDGLNTVSYATETAVATNQNAGSGNAMNIMNPYIVVYMWKRTA